MRSKLFLSYSNKDSKWRDRFIEHLKGLFAGDTLWYDQDDGDIAPGSRWAEKIDTALRDARCALLLLTPNYLDCSGYARKELEMALNQQESGLTLLPVLVEPCAWQGIELLRAVQFIRWPDANNGSGDIPALSEVGGAAPTAIDRVVIDICMQVSKAVGVVGQTTATQRDQLFNETRKVLGERVELNGAMVHSGDFSVVYSGTFEGDRVAVKSVPDAPRRNRIRTIFDQALKSAKTLSDPAFIRIRFAVTDREPHCLVMDYIDWPTLDTRLASCDGHRLPPTTVVQILLKIASAQHDAHRNDFSIGPLCPANIHVNDAWDVRLSPIRIEGQMARAAAMTMGQLLNWDALTHMSPEVSAGFAPSTPATRDMQGQYYLALLGLELLLGHRPFEVRCFDDLLKRRAFFDDPRSFFEEGGGTWADESPALAFLLTRMLARDPEHRLRPGTTIDELEAIAGEQLPDALRRQLDDDYGTVQCKGFATRFYEKLFVKRPDLSVRFPNVDGQAAKFAIALQYLIDFRPELTHSPFRDLARTHAQFNIGAPELVAFRAAFIEQVLEAFPGSLQHADAWSAAFARSIGAMQSDQASGSAPTLG